MQIDRIQLIIYLTGTLRQKDNHVDGNSDRIRQLIEL